MKILKSFKQFESLTIKNINDILLPYFQDIIDDDLCEINTSYCFYYEKDLDNIELRNSVKVSRSELKKYGFNIGYILEFSPSGIDWDFKKDISSRIDKSCNRMKRDGIQYHIVNENSVSLKILFMEQDFKNIN